MFSIINLNIDHNKIIGAVMNLLDDKLEKIFLNCSLQSDGFNIVNGYINRKLTLQAMGRWNNKYFIVESITFSINGKKINLNKEDLKRKIDINRLILYMEKDGIFNTKTIEVKHFSLSDIKYILLYKSKIKGYRIE
jgi:hypothetical protein